MAKRFQRFCHFPPYLDIFLKFSRKKTLCTLWLKGWGFLAKSIFFCNILNGDLDIDVLIKKLFKICLVVCLCGMLTKKWALVQPVTIWGCNTSHKDDGGGNSNGEGGFALCNTAVLKLYCKSYWRL